MKEISGCSVAVPLLSCYSDPDFQDLAYQKNTDEQYTDEAIAKQAAESGTLSGFPKGIYALQYPRTGEIKPKGGVIACHQPLPEKDVVFVLFYATKSFEFESII